jgi:predicted transcriptional regulator
VLFSEAPHFFEEVAPQNSSILPLSARLLCKFRPKPQVFISRAVDIDVNEMPNQATEEIMSDSDDKALVAQILSSYLSNNTVAANDLPTVIESVKRAFSAAGDSAQLTAAEAEPQKWQPAVPIKRSVTAEEITCLCCGEGFKSLKRHLQTAHQLTPEGYRAAFDLKSDYPLVAPAYAARRSDLAKALGLGRKPGAQAPVKKGAAKAKPAKKVAAAA